MKGINETKLEQFGGILKARKQEAFSVIERPICRHRRRFLNPFTHFSLNFQQLQPGWRIILIDGIASTLLVVGVTLLCYL